MGVPTCQIKEYFFKKHASDKMFACFSCPGNLYSCLVLPIDIFLHLLLSSFFLKLFPQLISCHKCELILCPQTNFSLFRYLSILVKWSCKVPEIHWGIWFRHHHLLNLTSKNVHLSDMLECILHTVWRIL